MLCLVFIYYFQPAYYRHIIIKKLYKRKSKYISYLKLSIPPLIIQTIKDYEINGFFFHSVVEPKMSLHPSFDFHYYDNKEIDLFLIKNFPIHIYSTYKKINPKFGACLGDFARYCLLYVYGGVYIDIKSDIKKEITPLLEKYNKKDTLVVSHWGYTKNDINSAKYVNGDILPFERGEIQNWCFLVTPFHPILKIVIDEMVTKINSGQNGTTKQFVLELTGPVMFSRVLYNCLQDEKLSNMVIITDDMNDYFNYTKLSIECIGDCKKYYYNNTIHYSNVDDYVIK